MYALWLRVAVCSMNCELYFQLTSIWFSLHSNYSTMQSPVSAHIVTAVCLLRICFSTADDFFENFLFFSCFLFVCRSYVFVSTQFTCIVMTTLLYTYFSFLLHFIILLFRSAWRCFSTARTFIELSHCRLVVLLHFLIFVLQWQWAEMNYVDVHAVQRNHVTLLFWARVCVCVYVLLQFILLQEAMWGAGSYWQLGDGRQINQRLRDFIVC